MLCNIFISICTGIYILIFIMCFLTILCYLPDKKMATTNKNNKEVKVPIQNEEEDKNNMSSF